MSRSRYECCPQEGRDYLASFGVVAVLALLLAGNAGCTSAAMQCPVDPLGRCPAWVRGADLPEFPRTQYVLGSGSETLPANAEGEKVATAKAKAYAYAATQAIRQLSSKLRSDSLAGAFDSGSPFLSLFAKDAYTRAECTCEGKYHVVAGIALDPGSMHQLRQEAQQLKAQARQADSGISTSRLEEVVTSTNPENGWLRVICRPSGNLDIWTLGDERKHIELQKEEQETAAEFQSVLIALPPGEYNIICTAEEYYPASRTIQIQRGKTELVDMDLSVHGRFYSLGMAQKRWERQWPFRVGLTFANRMGKAHVGDRSFPMDGWDIGKATIRFPFAEYTGWVGGEASLGLGIGPALNAPTFSFGLGPFFRLGADSPLNLVELRPQFRGLVGDAVDSDPNMRDGEDVSTLSSSDTLNSKHFSWIGLQLGLFTRLSRWLNVEAFGGPMWGWAFADVGTGSSPDRYSSDAQFAWSFGGRVELDGSLDSLPFSYFPWKFFAEGRSSVGWWTDDGLVYGELVAGIQFVLPPNEED